MRRTNYIGDACARRIKIIQINFMTLTGWTPRTIRHVKFLIAYGIAAHTHDRVEYISTTSIAFFGKSCFQVFANFTYRCILYATQNDERLTVPSAKLFYAIQEIRKRRHDEFVSANKADCSKFRKSH